MSYDFERFYREELQLIVDAAHDSTKYKKLEKEYPSFVIYTHDSSFIESAIQYLSENNRN